MKKIFRLMALSLMAAVVVPVTSCSDDKDDVDEITATVTLGFSTVSSDLIGGPTSYGENLYYGAPDQITKGYIAQISGDIYAQFPVNYAEQEWEEGKPWQYTFFNGGIAISNWHDMTDATYNNQLSVYSATSPSGGNFAVAFGGSSVTDPSQATLADYAECGRIYITDALGYGVANLGDKTNVSGDAEDAYFESVMINNTTYTYLTMKNGNTYASALNDENKGWLKVQFIAFDDDQPNSRPIGYVEAYLANFDESLTEKAGFCGYIIDTWTEVNLTSLPKTSVLVINFAGSDTGDFGLNTPEYCALDNFKISVEK